MSQEPKKILIVEDELPMLTVLKDTLTSAGFKIFDAQDGEAGLEIALREHPDLILLDIVLPKIDGLTLLARLREDRWGKRAVVVLLTNLNEFDKVAAAIEAGAQGYLVKSNWSIDQVVKKVKEVLKIRG